MTSPALRELPDASTIDAAATALTSFGSKTVSAVEGVSTTWGGLSAPGVYDTPERTTVLHAMRAPTVVATMIEQNAQTASRALSDYASTLGSLAIRRANLVSDLAAFAARPPLPPGDPTDPSSAPDPSAVQSQRADQSDLDARVTHFNSDADQADQQCAASLNALQKYSSDSVSRFLEFAGGNDLSGGAIGIGQGLVQGSLERWRRITLVPEDAIPSEALTIPEPDAWHGNIPIWKTAGGLDRLTPPEPGELAIPDHLPGHSTMVGDPAVSEGALPGIAKVGGRALGIAGVALTLGVTWDEQWKADEAAHPEWSTSQRAESATTTTVLTGGGSVIGGAAGAWGGALGGAAIGTAIFPGVGTVIGGVVGGAVVGYLGGTAGSKAGAWLEDQYKKSSLVSSVHHVWKDLFG